jgi:hypothetical protein
VFECSEVKTCKLGPSFSPRFDSFAGCLPPLLLLVSLQHFSASRVAPPFPPYSVSTPAMATTLAHTLPPALASNAGSSQPPRSLQQRSLAPSHAALAAQPAHVTSQHLPPRPPSAFPSPSPTPSLPSAAPATPLVGLQQPVSAVPFPSTSRCSHLPQALETGTDQQLERFRLAVRWSLKLASEHHQTAKRRKVSWLFNSGRGGSSRSVKM